MTAEPTGHVMWTPDPIRQRLADHCQKAKQSFNWQEEEKKLIAFYNRLFL